MSTSGGILQPIAEYFLAERPRPIIYLGKATILTTTAREPLVDTAIRNWSARFLATGVDHNDFVNTTASIETYKEWLPAWVANGDRHLERAKEEEAKGRLLTAGDAYVHASLSYHFASYLWLYDLDLYKEIRTRSIDAAQDAYRLLDDTHERLVVPFGEGNIYANFRQPKHVDGKSLLVVLVPGLDSTKEEWIRWEDVFLERGIATLSIDGPGQGEAGFGIPFVKEYEKPVGAFLDALEPYADKVDLTRVGITGNSFGGYFAPRAAAFEDRIKAVVANGGPTYDISDSWDRQPEMILEKWIYSQPGDTAEEARKATERLTLKGVAPQIEVPFMVVHGDQDWAFPWEGVKLIAEDAPQGELRLFKGAGHCVPQIAYIYKPLIADWLREKLTEATV